jgi:hypothetical protein
LAAANLELTNKQLALEKLETQLKKWLQLQQIDAVLDATALGALSETSKLQWTILQRKAVKYLPKLLEKRTLLHISIAELEAKMAALNKLA